MRRRDANQRRMGQEEIGGMTWRFIEVATLKAAEGMRLAIQIPNRKEAASEYMAKRTSPRNEPIGT